MPFICKKLYIFFTYKKKVIDVNIDEWLNVNRKRLANKHR